MAEIKAFEKKEEVEIEEIKDLQKKAMELILGKLDRQSQGQQATIIASSPDPLTFRNGSARSKTSEMFENCKAPPARSLHPALVATESHDAIQIEEHEQEEQDEQMNLTGRCNSYRSPAVWFRYHHEPTLWCCDTRNQDCNGCERQQKDRCTVREPAFVKLAGEPLYAPCMDIPGWANSAGKTCAQISENECSVKRSQGQSSREACCQCGGGIRSPTPFTYDDYVFVLGEDVKMYPKPRTATRYGVNDGCELALYNLTIDGETGVVSYIKGREKPKAPFKVSCKVTAFQLHHQIFTADVNVAVQELSYGASVLTFTPKTTLYKLHMSASSEWKDFSTNCAPDAKWLKLEDNGNLKVVKGGETGVVDSVQDTFNGQVATVCQLWAYSKAKNQKDAEWMLKSMGVVVVKPAAAPLLSYPTSTLTSAVGQAVPPVEPVAFPQGAMVPSSYAMRCDQANFKFDAVHGIGFYEGHPLLELQSNGQLSLNTGPSFARVFDAMGDKQDGSVVKLELKCRIVGVFPDSDFKPLTTKMNIVITDTTCWVQEKIHCGQQPVSKRVWNRAQCQHWCRSRSSCSAYVYDTRRRRRKRCIETKLNSVGGRTCDVYTKIPDCNPETACVQVDARTWLERGTYCPVGYDVDRGSMTYLKEGLTPNEMIYLRKFKTGADSLVEGCGDGDWLLQQQSAGDFQNKKKGTFEFAGPFVSCKVKSVSYTGLPCTQPPNITDEEDAVPRMILDNPDTSGPEDYWLHPCDCAPKVWGDAPPMDQEVFAALPPESPEQFIPAPVVIVEGQFVCPPNEMLGDGPIFETEDEAQEIGDCELKCKNMDECNYFWHGTQHALATCRLYTKCSHLVREPGVEGVLKAVPKIPACLVTAPEDCWSKTLRRVALTSDTVPSFWYWTLYAECDYMLLLGGWGVNGCSRPSVRDMNSHPWKHKRHLPATFKHGEMIQASCWSDRYEAINLGVKKLEAITCVNGEWFASNGLNGFEGFACLPCMQVGTVGFGDVHDKRQQELYYFNRLSMQLHSEVNPISDGKVSCLEPLTPPPEVTTDLPKDLKEAKSFDLRGYEFIEDDNVMGSEALWHSASQLSYSGMTVRASFGSKREKKRPLTATPDLKKCYYKAKGRFSFSWGSISNKKWWELKLKRNTWVTSLEFTVGGADCCKNGLKDVDIWAGRHKCASRITISEGETKRVRCYAKTRKIKITTGAFRAGADIQFCGIKVFGQRSQPKKDDMRKYFFQSLPEAQEACAKDHRCTMVSRDDGMSVDGAIRRYEMRRGTKIDWIGAKNWNKVKPIPCVGNCAGLKPVTCSAGMAGCAHKTLTDGLKDKWRWPSSPHSTGALTCTPDKEWVEVDLGAEMQFDQVVLFGYQSWWRRYCGTSIGVTKDKITWKWPFWSDGWRNWERGAGTKFNIGLQTARYVRVYLGKNNKNAHAHLLELEIYRASVAAPPEPKSKWITTAEIGHLGTRVKCKYSLLQHAANISANATEEDFGMEDEDDTEENLAAFQMETEEGARVVQHRAEKEAEENAEEEEEQEDSEEEEEEVEAEDSEEAEENETPEVEERTQRALLSKARRVKLGKSDEPDMLDEEEAYDGEEDYDEEDEEMAEMENEDNDDVAELEEQDKPTKKMEAANMTALSEEEQEDQSQAARRRSKWKRWKWKAPSLKKIAKKVKKKVKKAIKKVSTPRRRRSRRRRSRRRRTTTTSTSTTSTSTTTTSTTTTTTTCHYWVGVTGFGVDLTTHGKLKGGHIWASSHARKIECRLFCDHIHVLTVRHASLGRGGASAAIPAVCRGSQFLWLAGSASAGYCEFSWHKLEVYEFPKAIAVPKSQDPDLGIEAYGCAANYRPQGKVVLDVQEPLGFV
ncbi:ACBP2 [Symbiodinium sp. CCMP2592]|nr:ACBP2 [Symbiodinium sp. CCMP2592]